MRALNASPPGLSMSNGVNVESYHRDALPIGSGVSRSGFEGSLTAKKRKTSRANTTGRKKRATATLRSTSGAGFNFEDLISAWLQVKMLGGEPIPAIGGDGLQLQAQVSSLGWRIDDLLLTAQDEPGITRRLAISAKGNVQVTAAGLPADFVSRAWEQWRDPQSPMNRENDGLALVTQDTHREFNSAWAEVKNACSGSDIALAARRIRGNKKQLKLFDSVRKPNDMESEATDEETVELIRHLHVLPVDFQLAHSEIEGQAIARCRQLLASGELAEAEKLWKTLVNIAADVRIRRGTVTLEELWSSVRQQFALRQQPNFACDWETLTDLTADRKSRVETELPSGYRVDRTEEKAKLEAAVSKNIVTVVFGESGTGKSALVKNVLDEQLADHTQVWFGPEELKTALSAAKRGSLPLKHQLERVLNASTDPKNILVLDSAERIEPAEFGVVKLLFQSLMPLATETDDTAWRIVVISQPQLLVEGRDTILGWRQAELLEIELLKPSDVKAALWASLSLSWLASHDEIISTLTNLRTLAWVIKAGAALGDNVSGLASPTAIADWLWKYWTGGAAHVQALMMRLAEREASFERSFALTNLSPADTATFEGRPAQLPLRLNERTNRIEFEHDLAADWARFQFLKQIADNQTQWAPLAENPLWTNALRMLGQFLLRQPVGSKTAWDDAFGTAETTGLRLVGDILLDAICLDPEAERLLSERVELLFAAHAKHLTRLLSRFHHIGTMPTGGISGTSSLNLYMEAQFRSVIVGRWPPILRFLVSQRERIGGLVSAVIARLIQTWLNGTPRQLSDGAPFPFRRDLAEIALAMARTVQVEKGHGVIYAGHEPLLYTAPLAGAAELPSDVTNWALELAGRRKFADDVIARIAVVRRQQAEAHAARLQTDPEYKARHEKRLQEPHCFISSCEKLPPWPLGATRRVDQDFRKACFEGQGLVPLMHAQPEAAAEVLLALIIEDEPEREYESSRIEIELGLEFSQEAYPTIYWKSPFFQFFHIAPQEALKALIALVNFCTERWLAEVTRSREGPVPGVTLQLADGTTKKFDGWWQVFDWTQENSAHNGNLFCAMDALERWLTLRLDAGADITDDINQILRESSSVAFLGLLINVGKYRPALFSGALAPLLSDPHLFYWDNERVRSIGYKFDQFSWLRAGNVLFELARNWTLAPHRQRTLLDVAIELLKTDDSVAQHLKTLIPTWGLPDAPKAALECKLIFAALDRDNYQPTRDASSGEEILSLTYPEVLHQEVQQWHNQHAEPLQYMLLPSQCEKLLQRQQAIDDEGATRFYELLQSCESDDEPELKRRCKLALAAVLVVCADGWLSATPAVQVKVFSIVREAILEVGTTAEAIRSRRIRTSYDDMKFAAYAAMHIWMAGGAESLAWEGLVLRLLSSGDDPAASIIFEIAYTHRTKLGSVWWRLLLAGVLWSGLVLLSPSYENRERVERTWNFWLARFRRFPLARDGATTDELKLMRVAEGCERLEFYRQLRDYNSGDRRWRGEPTRGRGTALDTHFLGVVFHWLINGAGTGDWTEDALLTGRLWAFEADRAKARANGGEYDLPSQMFGYDILSKLAALSVTAPKGQARTVWEPVLSHGPEAHYAVRHFIRSLFLQLTEKCSADTFEVVWREVAEYGLAAKWEERGQHWFNGERILCDLLGFGHEDALRGLPSGAVLRMQKVYERWAKTHLERDEECVTRFCNFLASEFGAPLRLDGLCWIAELLTRNTRSSSWYRDGTGSALIELLNSSINQNAKELVRNSEARQALITIAADLAERNFPSALALQERIKSLR